MEVLTPTDHSSFLCFSTMGRSPCSTKTYSPTIIDIRRNRPTTPPFAWNDQSPCSAPSDSNEGISHTHVEARSEVTVKPDLEAPCHLEGEGQGGGVDDDTGHNVRLTSDIISGLTPADGQPKVIPTVVLYDDKGLQIYDRITYLEEYYLVQEEIDILVQDSDNIVDSIPDNSVVVELGSGSLRKTRVLLDALERRRKNIRYYALDLMRDELKKSLVNLGGYTNVTTAGLWGTYDEGMAFIGSFPADVPKTLLWLGSSIGNMTRSEATEFISSYRSKLNVGDNWLIGIDRRNAAEDITLAYNDPASVTREFIMNGLHHVNTVVGQQLFDYSKFDYFGRYNEDIGRHEAYYKVLESHDMLYETATGNITKISVVKDELINVEYSYKWSLAESSKLFQDTKMAKIGQWPSPSKRYDLFMLRKVPFFQPCLPIEFDWSRTTAGENRTGLAIPTSEDWNELWAAWDLVTMDMIRHPDMLLEKPIDLRHPFIFYIGHIPAFLDIQLSRAFDLAPTEPAYFTEIFERGIDPEVENPTKCHEHSKVPESWPALPDIITYRNEVRKRLDCLLMNNKDLTRRRARILFMTFEHQAMHLETILYMLVQSNLTNRPTGIRCPWLEGESAQKEPATDASWITVNPSAILDSLLTLGHNDPELEDDQNWTDLTTPFGWDNEHPSVKCGKMDPFQIQTRQVTNAEYLKFLQSTGNKNYPKSWQIDGDKITIRSVFGAVEMSVAKNWSVSCSRKEALAYISWIDPQGTTYSLPTEEQLAVTFKLKSSSVNGLLNCNYGFRAWYPQPSLSEHPVDNTEWTEFQGPGALWDWTNTKFGPLSSGYVTSQIYPGYSSDFFEGNHYVCLGASWATHPKIAERRSFRNWYQGNYEYAFIGFRLVRNTSIPAA